MPTLPPSRLVVRPTEAAAMLDVSRAYVYELIAAGKLESVKIGGARRVSVKSIERLASQGTTS